MGFLSFRLPFVAARSREFGRAVEFEFRVFQRQDSSTKANNWSECYGSLAVKFEFEWISNLEYYVTNACIIDRSIEKQKS